VRDYEVSFQANTPPITRQDFVAATSAISSTATAAILRARFARWQLITLQARGRTHRRLARHRARKWSPCIMPQSRQLHHVGVELGNRGISGASDAAAMADVTIAGFAGTVNALGDGARGSIRPGWKSEGRCNAEYGEEQRPSDHTVSKRLSGLPSPTSCRAGRWC